MRHETRVSAFVGSVNGSCLCGAVTFRAEAEVRVVNGHCGLCRKMNGSAFSSYAVVPHDKLNILGDSDLGAHAVTQRATKHYCRKCGTPLFNLNSKHPGACMLYLGTLKGGDAHSPALNVHCENMLPWVASVSSLKSFPEGTARDA